MTTRLIALRRGKTGETQRFSEARPADPAKIALLQSTVVEVINHDLRSQILADPLNCFRFACRWGDDVGFLTRPKLVTPEGDNPAPIVLGSFSDTIGQACPVSLSLDDFRGSFTTLVRRADAIALGLSTHPSEPSKILAPARNIRGAEPGEVSLERLGFPMLDEPEDGDIPVIAALPCFLPVGPGQTFPHPVPVAGPETFREQFLLFHVWCAGLACCLAHNNGRSVTRGGPLFHQPALVVPDKGVEPVAGYTVRERLLVSPVQLGPTTALYQTVSETITALSDDICVELGGNMEPEPVPSPPPQVGFGAEQVRAVVEPLVNKEKVFRLADKSKARYRLLLAAQPMEGSPDMGTAVLPDLRKNFRSS